MIWACFSKIDRNQKRVQELDRECLRKFRKERFWKRSEQEPWKLFKKLHFSDFISQFGLKYFWEENVRFLAFSEHFRKFQSIILQKITGSKILGKLPKKTSRSIFLTIGFEVLLEGRRSLVFHGRVLQSWNLSIESKNSKILTKNKNKIEQHWKIKWEFSTTAIVSKRSKVVRFLHFRRIFDGISLIGQENAVEYEPSSGIGTARNRRTG